MTKALVIVESPTKAKTIKKFLPKDFVVEASMGHIRDLPQSAADIPAAMKKLEWTKLGVNVDDNFEPLYIVPKDKTQRVRDLKALAKKAEVIYLATDEDREGESISWHLLELLQPKVPVKRMVFHEITKKAILGALENCRDVDMNLVRAQETRRILDRLYGYTLSPLIWKKIAYGLSAGRVQSTGLKMIVERERERMIFKKSDYHSVKATLLKDKFEFEARLNSVADKKLAIGKDFEPTTGKLLAERVSKVVILDAKKSADLIKKISGKQLKVVSVEDKEMNSHPAPPFITSTLQQEGIRKLGMSARETMRTAQALYENGFITYMRTDSTSLSTQAVDAARESIVKLYGKEYLHSEVRTYSKSKGAQEAHEAIRPSGSEFIHPDATGLRGKELDLYELIWKRTMATQMAPAKKLSMTVKFEVEDCEFVANGSRILFPGFLRVYVEGSDDPEAALDNREVLLPELKVDQLVAPKNLEAQAHETKPPARFTEASLVQRLEKEGIGRPSTYATIIATIQDRGYVRKDHGALIPSFTGIAVVQLLEDHFEDLITYTFTSEMENSLDNIAEGTKDSQKYLKSFYSGASGLKNKVDSQDKKIKPDASRTIRLPQLENVIDIKVGRYGPYIVSKVEGSKEEVHASIPEDIAPADLKPENLAELIAMSQKGPEPIGKDPKTGKNIYCLIGRYGAYVQLGEVVEGEDKPRRSSLTPPMTPQTITLEQALKLLSLPRDLGKHPETGKNVQANLGKFGPYVVHDGDFRSLKKTDDLYAVTLERALEILNEPKVSARGASVFKEFGAHPKTNKKISAYDGKYGLFLKHGTKNVGLPDDMRNPDLIKSWTIKEASAFVDKMEKSSKSK